MATRTSAGELVFGIVAPAGTASKMVTETLKDVLADCNYATEDEPIAVIELLHAIEQWQGMAHSPEILRYAEHIKGGSEFCEALGQGSALEPLVIREIQRLRSMAGDRRTPQHRHAYILRSLKRPEEIEAFRQIYGNAFVLIAAYSPREFRQENLRKRFRGRPLSKGLRDAHPDLPAPFKDSAESAATYIIEVDEKEPGRAFGQNVQRAFPMADVFVPATDNDALKRELKRFIHSFLGHQFFTPTIDELSMAHAFTSRLRSADLSRQVGAAIVSTDGDILALGTNEVPKAGGGQYMHGDQEKDKNKVDERDFRQERYEPYQIRREVLTDMVERLAKSGYLTEEKTRKAETDPNSVVDELLQSKQFGKARVMSSIEFARVVHAEMAALMDAARRGIPVRGATLYSTTFPCHGCAPHIVASGIRRVVYIEPYAKSVVKELFGDSIAIDSPATHDNNSTKVLFQPFVGIAPRLFHVIFAMGDRQGLDGQAAKWEKRTAVPRIQTEADFYLEREEEQINSLESQLAELNLTFVPEAKTDT